MAIALKAERDLARIKPLYEQQAASQLDLDNAIAAYESAKADVHISEANLTEARVGVAIAERFPSFVINLGAGLENDELKDFLKSPFWMRSVNICHPRSNSVRPKPARTLRSSDSTRLSAADGISIR